VRRRECANVAIVALLGLLAACTSNARNGATGSPGSTRPATTVLAAAARPVSIASPVTLTGNELKFGLSPHPDGSVVLQPDVVVISSGADAVKGVNDNGMVWTMSGDAPGVDHLAVGKIMMATAFGTGRVLSLDHVGSDVRVVLGPVELTDIIADADVSTAQPIAFDKPTVYQVKVPDQTTDAGSTPTSASGFRLTGPRPATELPPLPSPTALIPDVIARNWYVQVKCCSSVGLHMVYSKGGAKVNADASFDFTAPNVDLGLVVKRGKVAKASIELTGATGLRFDIGASVEKSAADFKLSRVDVPLDLTLQVPVGGIPMVFGLHQFFGVGLGLSGGAFMTTRGEYALTGKFGFAYNNGVFTKPKIEVTTTSSAINNMISLSVAPQALDIAYGLRVSLGVGFTVLNVGAWASGTAKLALASSSMSSLTQCKTVALDITGKAGVGYELPDIVASAINFFLHSVIKVNATIQPRGGPSTAPWVMFHKDLPPCSK
jgi:hypothetical protein